MLYDDAIYLQLADWRRRVATLFSEVRRIAQEDPERAHAHWRTTREQLYRQHAQSPVPAVKRETFRAQYFPYDRTLRFELEVQLDEEEAAAQSLPAHSMSADGTVPSPRRIGWVDVPLAEGQRRLGLYWLDGYANGLFLPFRDATNGHETYGAGRYLIDGPKSADLGGNPSTGMLVLDFNFAYHPSCAFDARWVCPLAPRENWLDVRMEAGERL